MQQTVWDFTSFPLPEIRALCMLRLLRAPKCGSYQLSWQSQTLLVYDRTVRFGSVKFKRFGRTCHSPHTHNLPTPPLFTPWYLANYKYLKCVFLVKCSAERFSKIYRTGFVRANLKIRGSTLHIIICMFNVHVRMSHKCCCALGAPCPSHMWLSCCGGTIEYNLWSTIPKIPTTLPHSGAARVAMATPLICGKGVARAEKGRGGYFCYSDLHQRLCSLQHR